MRPLICSNTILSHHNIIPCEQAKKKDGRETSHVRALPTMCVYLNQISDGLVTEKDKRAFEFMCSPKLSSSRLVGFKLYLHQELNFVNSII